MNDIELGSGRRELEASLVRYGSHLMMLRRSAWTDLIDGENLRWPRYQEE